MPPNKVGGKNYKKGKHVDEDPIIYERQPDQMYGRVIRLLGGCNAIVYCNDNRERLCHIRGSMRKKVWIATGDIVLISIRDMTRFGENENVYRGDICARYDPKVIYKLQQKDRTINEKLFTIIEKTENVGSKNKGTTDDDFGFVFDSTDNQVVNEDGSEEDSDVDESLRPANRAAQRRAMQNQDDDDVDIDNI